MAITDIGGVNAFFTNDLCHLLITEGNATADRLQAHFTTSNSSFQHKGNLAMVKCKFLLQGTVK